MRVGVVGCGSIGLRHVGNLVRLPGVETFVFDVEPERAKTAADRGARVCRDLDEMAAASPEAVLICTPAPEHVAGGLWALERGAHLFVEKPLATRHSDALTLVRAARERERVLAVGYMLRFDHGLRRLREALSHDEFGRVAFARWEFGQYLPTWRPQRDYRATPSAQAAQGGGILLEASHEIDALLWLFGDVKAVYGVMRRQSDLEVDVEDTVSAILEFASGVIAELHLDFVQHGYRRDLRVAAALGTAEWRLREGVTYAPSSGAPLRLAEATPIDSLYVDELGAFLRDLTGGGQTLANGEDGLRTLAVIEAIRASESSGRRIAVGPS
jgi:predicted dehydrogenase